MDMYSTLKQQQADLADLKARVEALEEGALPGLTASAEVKFASDEAAERLAASGLKPITLLAYEPSARGGYTVADVERAIEAQE